MRYSQGQSASSCVVVVFYNMLAYIESYNPALSLLVQICGRSISGLINAQLVSVLTLRGVRQIFLTMSINTTCIPQTIAMHIWCLRFFLYAAECSFMFSGSQWHAVTVTQ